MSSLGQRPDSAAVDYTGVLRRRWWVVVAGAVLGLLGALVYVVMAPKTYMATATVYVSATGADVGNGITNSRTSGAAVDLDTEAQLVTSGTVAALAGKTIHSSLSPYALSKLVSVTVPPNSQVLDIACSAPTATGAAACANAFAAGYLKNRSDSATSVLTTQLNNVQGKVSGLGKSISRLTTEISGQPKNSPARASAEVTLSTDRAQARQLNAKASTLISLLANVTGGHVITKATPPGKPSSPSKTLVLPSGLVAGLLIGLIAAFVWDRRDKRLHSPQDVERLLDLPVLLSLPRNAFSRQLTLASPRSRTGRAFTELAHTVAASLGEGSHVLLVAGASPGRGASVTAANLAATLARTHSEAVLVCADLRDSVAPELFGLADSRGLAEVLAGRATVGEVAHGPSGVPGLWVIPPGTDTSLAEYNLQHDTAKALTTQLRRDARYVIIEAQATEDGADTFALAEFADAALLATETGHTRHDEAAACIRRLHRMRIPLLGAAVLPPISGRASIRPAPPQLRPGPQADRDNTVTSRPHSGLPGTPEATGLSGRPARSREGHGDPADRVPGR